MHLQPVFADAPARLDGTSDAAVRVRSVPAER